MMVAGMKNGEMRRGPVLQQVLVFALDDFKSADAAADIDADALRVLLGDLEAAGAQRIQHRRDTHLDEAAHLLDFFLLDEAGRIEMLDLARDPAVERRRIEGLDARDAVAAFEQRLPGVLRGVANRGQETDTGDYDSAGNNRSPLKRQPAGSAHTRASHPRAGAPKSGHPIGCFHPPASGKCPRGAGSREMPISSCLQCK